MDRKLFLKTIGLTTLGMVSLKEFASSMSSLKSSDELMPVMFIGHGNPMNAIEDNEYSRAWAAVGKRINKPSAILCVSAHWLTKGTKVTAMEKPETIHDFYGFPKELQDAQYPAPGSPYYAKLTKETIHKTIVDLDEHQWGLDHGSWSVLKPMFPNADIPVFQLSIDYNQSPQYHYDLAKELQNLRSKGVLIIGSGNIVHNLGLFRMTDSAYDWAVEFDDKIKNFISAGDHASIIDYEKLGQIAKLSVPTNDHYLPLLYTLALQNKSDKLEFFNNKTTAGSISMTSLIMGNTV